VKRGPAGSNLPARLLVGALVLLPSALAAWTGIWAFGVSAVILVILLRRRRLRLAENWREATAGAVTLIAGVVAMASAGVAIADVGALQPYDQRVGLGWVAMALAALATAAGLSTRHWPIAACAVMLLAGLMGAVAISFFYVNTYYFAAVPLWLIAAAFTIATDSRTASPN
jgi:hypothetical protein